MPPRSTAVSALISATRSGRTRVTSKASRLRHGRAPVGREHASPGVRNDPHRDDTDSHRGATERPGANTGMLRDADRIVHLSGKDVEAHRQVKPARNIVLDWRRIGPASAFKL